MDNIVNFQQKPINTRTWKMRPANRPKKKETMSKDPEDYIFQSQSLYYDLELLKYQKSNILEKINRYLEVDFFFEPEQAGSNYFSFLSSKGLKLVNIFKSSVGSQAYFEIFNYEDAVQYLKEAIDQLSEFSNSKIEKSAVKEKRIILWKSFRLSTKDVKEKASKHITPFNKVRVDINFILQDNLSAYSSQISAAATEENIKLEINQNSLSIEDIPEGIRKTKSFLDKISRIDNIRSIELSEFVSFVEHPLTGLSKDTSEVKITKIASDAPVIAVIDTGVVKDYFTEGFLLEGLDYTKDSNNPVNGNPYQDSSGHGTAVACEIVYGKNIVDYFINKKANELIPLFKIFPVKVFLDKEENVVDYETIFSLTGHFAQAVRKHGIKIINISFGSKKSKKINEKTLSKSAQILDIFAREFNVIFVVATGNIDLNKLEELTSKYPDLLFYENPDYLDNENDTEEVNISAPSDLLSGISVGSCIKQVSKYATSSFSKSYSLDMRGFISKPDVLSIGGGDWPVDLTKNPPVFHYNLSPAIVMSKDFLKLDCMHGTSLSTPRISRALGFCIIKYPEVSTEALKGILLHKLGKHKTSKSKLGVTNNKVGVGGSLKDIDISFQNQRRAFHNSYLGHGTMTEIDEDILLSDNEDEVTLLIEGVVKSKQIVTYEVPITTLLGDQTKNKTNKIRIKLSVCILPTIESSEIINLSEANKFKIAAILHKNSVSPTLTKTQNKRVLKDQCISSKADGVILKWTSDYYSKFNPTFQTVQRDLIKEELSDIIGNSETVSISVRGLNKSSSSEIKRFALVFSIEDLGATGQIKNQIIVKL